MKMNKKMLCRISVLASLALLFTSGLANASVLSPYNNAKEALKKSIQANDVTVSYVSTVAFENDSYAEEYVIKMDGRQNRYSAYSSPGYAMEDYRIDKVIYSHYDGNEEDGKPVYYSYEGSFDFGDEYGGVLGMSGQMIRVGELLLDAFSANSKDYLQEREENGNRIVYGTLDSTQIPEVARAALSYTASVNSERFVYAFGSNFSDALMQKTAVGLKDIYIQEVSGECVIDENGYMTDMDITVQFVFVTKLDEKLVATSRQQASFTDIGKTSVIWPPSNDIVIVEAGRFYDDGEEPVLDDKSLEILERLDRQEEMMYEIFWYGDYTDEQLEEMELLLEEFYDMMGY